MNKVKTKPGIRKLPVMHVSVDEVMQFLNSRVWLYMCQMGADRMRKRFDECRPLTVPSEYKAAAMTEIAAIESLLLTPIKTILPEAEIDKTNNRDIEPSPKEDLYRTILSEYIVPDEKVEPSR